MKLYSHYERRGQLVSGGIIWCRVVISTAQTRDHGHPALLCLGGGGREALDHRFPRDTRESKTQPRLCVPEHVMIVPFSSLSLLGFSFGPS